MFKPSPVGEKWKRDVESMNCAYSDDRTLANHIRDYLRDNYPNVHWFVVVYSELTGYEAHTVKGHYYNRFRRCGHNIVVSRVVAPRGDYAPTNLQGTFQSALSVQTYTTGWLFTTTHLHAKNTVDRTWSNLGSRGLSPVMLLVFKDSSYGWAWSCDNRCMFTSISRGYAAIIAEDRR